MSSTDSLVVPPAVTKSGCLAFDITIGGADGVTWTPAPIADCGPVTPLVTGARFDAKRRVVQLTMALRNGGNVWLHAPTKVVATRANLLTGVSGPQDQPLAQWSFDTFLRTPTEPPVTAADGSLVLPSSATSVTRIVEFPMPATATRLHVTLTASGTYVFTVPGRPPDSIPLDEQQDSRSAENLITGDPHFPGRVVRNKLWLTFRKGATAEDREAAIEAVNGIVVGGMVRSTGNRYPPPSGPHMQRYYYVRIPAYPDSGAVPLERAIRTLAPLPQVQDVEADVGR